MLDLQALALRLVEGLVVGHFVDDAGDRFAEGVGDHLAQSLLIFDGIMQPCLDDDVRIASHGGFRDQHCDFEQVIYIRFLRRALATVVHVPLRRRVGGAQDGDKIVFHGTLACTRLKRTAVWKRHPRIEGATARIPRASRRIRLALQASPPSFAALAT